VIEVISKPDFVLDQSMEVHVWFLPATSILNTVSCCEGTLDNAQLLEWSRENLPKGHLSLLPAAAAPYIRLAWRIQSPGRVWIGHQPIPGKEGWRFRLTSAATGLKGEDDLQTLGISPPIFGGSRIMPNDRIALQYHPHPEEDATPINFS
jgi:hypothetical protein